MKRGSTPSPASDVYSLGVVFEQVIAASGPWAPSTRDELLAIATRARAELPGDRYADGTALLSALEGMSLHATPRRIRRRALSATALIVGAGCALLGDGPAMNRGTASAANAAPVLAVVTRVDDASSVTTSAAAAQMLRRAIGTLRRARLVSDAVPPFSGDIGQLVEDLKFAGVTHALIATASPTSTGTRVTVVVHRAADGAVVTTTTRTGSRGDLEATVHGVADDLRDWLGEAPRQPRPPPKPISVASVAQYSEARRYLERPDRDDGPASARRLLEAVVARDPEYAPAYADLARTLVLLWQGRSDASLLLQARNAADRAVRLAPQSAESHLALATVFMATGRREDADTELRGVLELDPSHELALRLLGQNLAARNLPDEAVEVLRRLVSVYPSWGSYRALGTVYFAYGRYREALETYQQLTELQPDNAWGFQMVGSAHQVLGDVDAAVRAYTASIRLKPQASALTNLATIHYERDDLAEAERLYAQAVALQPDNAVFLRNLADVQLRRERRADAMATYARAVAAADVVLGANPGDTRARGNAAYASARQGQCETSAAHASALAESAPRQVAALANRINASALCGQFGQARAAFDQLRTQTARPVAMLEHDVVATLRQRPEFAGLIE